MSDVPKAGDLVRVPFGTGEFRQMCKGYVMYTCDVGRGIEVMVEIDLEPGDLRVMCDLDEVEILERNAKPLSDEEEFWLRTAQPRDTLETQLKQAEPN
jgi:hypothetical protein